MRNHTIPQSFIDHTTLELDTLMSRVKGTEPQDISVEDVALILYDKRGLISDTEHRQVLSIMAAVLIKRAAHPNG